MSWSKRLTERDAGLAGGKFAGRESATDRADRLRRAKNAKAVTKADRAGQAWEDEDRRRFG